MIQYGVPRSHRVTFAKSRDNTCNGEGAVLINGAAAPARP
jgi:hypothetical protein